MKKITFIQIGDVHFQDKKDAHLNDIKDKAVDSDFINNISPNPFSKVSTELVRVIQKMSISGILLSGDLSSRGCLDSYKACVDHFVELSEIFTKDEKKIHVVPGNHDIDRKTAIEGNHGDKFKPFQEIWKKIGLDILKPEEVRTSLIESNNNKIRFFSLNTCVGCGEVRALDNLFSTKLLDKLQSEDNEFINELSECLDSPAVNSQHIGKIEDQIKDDLITDNVMPIVLAHHGILPQSTLRVAPYTEMMNGGYVRSVFSSLGHPIVYCHGHIHEDPVEIISTPKYINSDLISISAPEFSDGFNVIDVHYSSQNVPIGLTVTPYRVTNFGSVRAGELLDVKISTSINIEEVCGEDTIYVYKNLPKDEARYSEIVSQFEENKNLMEKLPEILMELHWAGLINVEKNDRKHTFWLIKRNGL